MGLCRARHRGLGPRGRANACAGGLLDQPLDAYAGLNFLAAQRFVDPDRIADARRLILRTRKCGPKSRGKLQFAELSAQQPFDFRLDIISIVLRLQPRHYVGDRQ